MTSPSSWVLLDIRLANDLRMISSKAASHAFLLCSDSENASFLSIPPPTPFSLGVDRPDVMLSMLQKKTPIEADKDHSISTQLTTLFHQNLAARALRLGDDGGGSGRLVLPGGGKDTDGLVVAGKTVDTGLNENEAELGVLVLAVALEVLADGNSLFVTER